jgi:NitT/TauT family transport system substrate-binding protein
MNRLRSLLNAVLVTMLGLSGAALAQEQALTKLRLGAVPIYETLPVWIGKDQGFFKEEGIDLDLVPTTGGATAVPAMVGGSLDIAYSEVGTILKSAQQGLALKIVAPSGTVSLSQNKDGARYLASASGPIKQLSDVKGKRIAVNQLKNIVHLYVLASLDNMGIPPDSYSVVEVPYPQMPDALLNGQVDLIYEVDPFVTILLNSGKVRDFGSATYAIHPNLRIAAYVASDRWLKQNPDLIRRFQRAYARSAEYVMNNIDKHGDWQVKFFRLKPELKDKVTPGQFLDREVSSPAFMESLTKTKGFMLKYKYLDRDMDLHSLVYR